ncbi:MAG: hypothetical protein H6715_06740 [Myxococcales bacterium]|nr:hypothetical protein [Myxococcales bacterium]MCB9708245.1 hypothetical protein [Myxococcales bacterium]
MKPRLPLWSDDPNNDELLRQVYPAHRMLPPLPIVCIGSALGDGVNEPAADIFFKSLPRMCAALRLSITWYSSAGPPLSVSCHGDRWQLHMHPTQWREALPCLVVEAPRHEFIVTDNMAWHFLYKTLLSVKVGRPPHGGMPDQSAIASRPFDLWLLEPRHAVLTGLGENFSFNAAPAC